MEPTLSTPPTATELTPSFTPDGRVLFGCGSCKKKLSVKPTTIGKSITCPHCKTANIVPDPAVKAEEPIPTPAAAAAVLTPGGAEPAPVMASLEPVLPASVAIEPVTAAAPEPVPAPVVTPAPSAPAVQAPVAANLGAGVSVSRPAPAFSADGRVVFVCSNCGKKLSVKPTTIGKSINCAHCQTGNIVPDPAAAAVSTTPAPVEAAAVVASTPAVVAPVVVSAAAPAEPVTPAATSAATPEPVGMPAPVAVPAPAAVAEPVKAEEVKAPEPQVQASAPAVTPAAPVIEEPAAAVQAPAAPTPKAVAGGAAGKPKAKIDGPDRFVFSCYFCARKMSVKMTSVGRSLKCDVCHNENIVPSPEQIKGPDVVTPTKEQWAIASQNVASGEQVEVRVFFPCYSCHKKLSAKIDQAGQAMRCTGCSVVNVVPGLGMGLISPIDESSSSLVSHQVAYDRAVAEETTPSRESMGVPVSTGESTVVMVSSPAATPSQGIPGDSKVSASQELASPIVAAAAATEPTAPGPVSVSKAAEPVNAAEYVVPTARLEPEKPLGLADLGTPSPVAAAATEVPEAFSPAQDQPELTPELDEDDDDELGFPGAPAIELEVKPVESKPAEPTGLLKVETAKKDELTLSAPGTGGTKTGILELPGHGLEHLGKAQALAMLAQAIPSAKPKAAEIAEDSAVLPPVKQLGMHSEIALRRPTKASKPEPSTQEGADFSLPEPKQASSQAKAKSAESDDDVFEPIGPMTSGPVAPPKSVLIEPIEALAALHAPAPVPVKPAAPVAPAAKGQDKQSSGIVPAGFIAFRCQGCSKRLTVKAKHAGQEMPCPVCKQMNKVPAETPKGVMDGPLPSKPAAKAPQAAPGASKPAAAPAPVAKDEKKPLAAPAAKPAAAAPAVKEEKKPAAAQPAKPAAAPPPSKPAAKPAAAPAAKAPAKPAAKIDPDDPFASLAQASQGPSLDLSDALSAMAGGAGGGGSSELDDLASALGGGGGEADADDITTALASQMDQPDDGLVINPATADPVDDPDAPIGLAEDSMPGFAINKPAGKGAPTPQMKGPVPNAGKFIPTNKNDGKLRFPCGQCGHRLKVPPEAKGKKAKCPACGTVNNVPN